MSSTTLIEIGAMLAIIVLLVSNYFFVRELRKTVDSEGSTYFENIQESDSKNKWVFY